MSDYHETYRKKIGEFMRYARKERGYTLDQMVEMTGISKPTLVKIENGKGPYEDTALITMMRHLQIHLELSLMSADNNIWTMSGGKDGD